MCPPAMTGNWIYAAVEGDVLGVDVVAVPPTREKFGRPAGVYPTPPLPMAGLCKHFNTNP